MTECDTPSGLGDFSDEAPDTELARTVEPKHINCVSSELLTDLQGLRPAKMPPFLGDDEKRRFRVTGFFRYSPRAKGGFESPLPSLSADSCSEPCGHCNFHR